MRELVTFERFVNKLGRKDSNYPMDQDVEFSNKEFKENFTLSYGEPSEAILHRLSKSTDKLMKVISAFKAQFKLESFDSRRTISASQYKADVLTLSASLTHAAVFTKRENRHFHNTKLNLAAVDPMQSLDLYSLREWMVGRISIMLDHKFLF